MKQHSAKIPVIDMAECMPGADFIIKTTQCADVPARLRKPHRNSGYRIGLLIKGELSINTDFRRYIATAPSLMFLSPDQVHQYVDTNEHEMVHISFNKDFLLKETEAILSSWECMFNKVLIPVLEEDAYKELLTYVNLMQHEFVAMRPQRDVIIKNLLNAFIISAARLTTCSCDVVQMDFAQNNIVRQFKMLTDEHFLTRTQVSKYADMLYITPGYLNDVIKSATGRTAKQIIDERRIVEAKRLLFWGEHSVKEIAGLMNFEDDAYFNRFFKKHTGDTPALFQKKSREKYN